MIDKLSEQEIIQALTPFVPPSSAFVYYDEMGGINMISPRKYNDLQFIEVPFERVRDFLEGKKDYTRYDLEYFKTGAVKIIENANTIRKNLIYEIQLTDNSNQVNVFHNKESWEFLLSNDAIDALERTNLNSTIKFYVTIRSKPQLLITTIEIKKIDLLTKKIVNFIFDEEKDLNKISLYTFPEFDSYGLIKND